MEWTRDKTLALINEYRQRRELWDMTSDDYRKKEMKTKFLSEVSNNLGGNIPIIEIEKKFHTLRTQYHREINRMKRKENYKSKWFGFKNLQFLSSPKACRSNKGRIKEITEDGTLTTKYILPDNPHETSGCSLNSSTSTIQDEFLTIHRKPTISYETTTASRSNGVTAPSSSTATSRAHELEKLIEETTKDVEDIEESKPKIIKEITMPMDSQGYAGSDEVGGAHVEQMHGEHESGSHHHSQEQHQMEEDVGEPLESIAIQGADGEITYHQANAAQATTIHNLPRIIKIQRRETISGAEEDYYEHQQQQQHMHAMPPTKRIYYGTNGQHATAILAPSTPTAQQSSGNSTMLSTTQHRSSLLPSSQSPTATSGQQAQQIRDDFTTYGEYVANEMRNLNNREVLIALKHKINNAIYEASMAELQK